MHQQGFAPLSLAEVAPRSSTRPKAVYARGAGPCWSYGQVFHFSWRMLMAPSMVEAQRPRANKYVQPPLYWKKPVPQHRASIMPFCWDIAVSEPGPCSPSPLSVSRVSATTWVTTQTSPTTPSAPALRASPALCKFSPWLNRTHVKAVATGDGSTRGR